MNYSIMFVLIFTPLLSTTATTLYSLGHFDRNSLETYEEISSEQDDINIFSNLTFRFNCEGKSSGFYADMDYNCRIFHVCDNSGNGFPVICANDTIFDQRQRICTNEENIDCQHAHEWYYLNELTYSTEITEDNESKIIQEDMIPSVLPLVID